MHEAYTEKQKPIDLPNTDDVSDEFSSYDSSSAAEDIGELGFNDWSSSEAEDSAESKAEIPKPTTKRSNFMRESPQSKYLPIYNEDAAAQDLGTSAPNSAARGAAERIEMEEKARRPHKTGAISAPANSKKAWPPYNPSEMACSIATFERGQNRWQLQNSKEWLDLLNRTTPAHESSSDDELKDDDTLIQTAGLGTEEDNTKDTTASSASP